MTMWYAVMNIKTMALYPPLSLTGQMRQRQALLFDAKREYMTKTVSSTRGVSSARHLQGGCQQQGGCQRQGGTNTCIPM
jgi:hypothetical protein